MEFSNINNDCAPLFEIFYKKENNQNELIPIIENNKKIKNLIPFFESKDNNINDKYKCIMCLFSLFNSNINLIPRFIHQFKRNNLNLFYESIFDIYLNKEIKEDKENDLEKMITLLITNTSLPRSAPEYLYQKMSKYFEKENELELNEELFMKYLKLLHLCYKDYSLHSDNNENKVKTNIDDFLIIDDKIEEEKAKKIKDVKNYIYFSGINSFLALEINHSSINSQKDFPSLKNGCSFVFWINIDKQILKNYNNINSFKKNIYQINLISIKIGEHQIKLILKDIKYFQLVIDDKNSNLIDVNDQNIFEYGKWVNICFIIKDKVNIYINNHLSPLSLPIPKNFPINEKIDCIILFQNLIGRVSSLLFFSFSLPQKLIHYFESYMKGGIYNNKILFKFLLSNDNNYFKNSINYKYYEKYKNLYKKDKFIDISLKGHIVKNIISIFTPFTYNESESKIDDIFGNYKAVLSINDGVNYYTNHIKNIQIIGGISNLLPIAELMLNNRKSNNKNNIITEKTLLKYLSIIRDIIIGYNNNIFEANKTFFFSNLGLFLERFPSEIYTEKILRIMLDIGKEVTKYNDIKNTSKNDNYYNNILLNEKIVSKFSMDNQVILWNEVNNFFFSDDSKMNESLNINKICILLRFYDENRYKEYCCKKHANIIKSQSKAEEKNNKIIKNIMNPEMNKKTEKLFEIIQLYIKKFNTRNVTVNLYKLLLLDLSPCLQIKIIQVYINYFKSQNIAKKQKEITISNLIQYNYFEISEYVFSISLLDVRIEILKLFGELYHLYKDKIKDYFKNILKSDISVFFNYLGDNIFLDHLYVEIEHNKKNKDDTEKAFIRKKSLPTALSVRKRTISPTNLNHNIKKEEEDFYEKNIIYKERIPLVKYINKDIYHQDQENLWQFLISWMMFEDNDSNDKDENKINYIIKNCIIMAKNNINNIINFLIFLYTYCKDEAFTKNKEKIRQNKQLYSWVIEIIFYYHNEENTKNITDKTDLMNISNIKIKSLVVLPFFFKNTEGKEFEENVQFIFDYSLYIKNKVNEENMNDDYKKQRINEISRIARELLLKCYEFSNKYTNILSKVCFRFLIYFKKSKLTVNENNIFKIGLDEDDSFEIIENTNNIKFEYNTINNNNNKNKNKEDFNNLKENFIKNDSLIPSYILEGINIDHSKISDEFNKDNTSFKNKKFRSSVILNKTSLQTILKPKKDILLKEIWKDFQLYDYIIDYYCSNLWGIQCLCKKVNIEGNNPTSLIKKLFNEYNNKNRNILLNPLIECFNINNIENNKFIKKNIIENDKQSKELCDENILTMNLILLSIAIEITDDKNQLEFLENQYQQLLIFCILSSINIKSCDKKYDFIQLELYNILGYGCLFLKEKNETKYQQIVKLLINPIFKELNEMKSKLVLQKLLKIKKKNIYSKTAVFKVFGTKEKDDNDSFEIISTKTFDIKIGEHLFESISNDKSDKNNNKKNDSICLVENNNDLDDINADNIEIKPELNVDKDKRIAAIYTILLNQFRKSYNNYISLKGIVNQNYNTEGIKREKKRVFNKVKELIPIYIEKLKKYSSSSYLSEKLRKNNYKRCKKNLFSWRGFWSNKYLFFTHPEYLKLKIKNHYSKEMIKPLLTPVLDINYYLPDFKLFKKQKLFNRNDFTYNINLDVDEILNYEVNQNQNHNKELFNSLKNIYGFNYLECLYKIVDEEIWDFYKSSQEEKLNPNKLIKRKSENILIRAKKIIKKEIKNHAFICCMVKVTNHIKGHLSTEKNYIKFRYDAMDDDNNANYNNNSFHYVFKDLENDISYDKELKCCYGSMFKTNKRYREKINFIINYEDIKYLFIRNYYYRDTAVEIFTDMNKSYFFNFKNNNELSLFISDVTNNDLKIKFRPISSNIHNEKEKTKKIGYEKLIPSMKNKVYHISSKTEDWLNYNISTFEYLMWLNIYSGRSFNDLNQYPVFPWIFTNYSNNEITNNDFRNLDTPIGMLEICEASIKRKTNFISFYETLKENFEQNFPDIDYPSFLNKGKEYLDSYKKKKQKLMKKEKNQNLNDEELEITYNDIPYNYGTHYSNPTYVSHYLCRIFPFSFISIEIHGDKFEDIDRMFCSIEKTFESVSTLKDDIREIIPEFYFFPDLFKNSNNLDLAQDGVDSNGNKVELNNVIMPLWSQKNAENFIIKHREGLESDKININKWIDIIFGSYQRGENAEKINNIFRSYTYEKMMNILEINDFEQRSALLRLYETGVTPRLLFKNDLKARIEKSVFIQKNSNVNLGFLEDIAALEKKYQNMSKYQLLNDNNKLNGTEKPKIIKIIIKNNDKLEIFTNTNHYFELKLQKEKDKEKNEIKNTTNLKDQKIFLLENTSTIYSPSYQLSSIEIPIIIYNNNKLVIKGGFWDGRLEINSILSDSKEESKSLMVFSGYDQPIVCMKMTKDEKMLICGTKLGSVIVYNVNGYNLELKDIIYSHSDEITSISIDDNLNMFATTSLDGYINLHILPSLQLIRVIHISSLKPKIVENNDNIIINDINTDKKKFNEEIFEEYNEEKCLYADNVFLSSSPLSCIVIFISSKKVFRTYTINGELINEIEEKEFSKIYSPIVYKNMNFFEYLIYGTNNGLIQIRSFPKMELINSFILSDNTEIKTLSLSNDKRFCYTWEGGDNLSIIYNSFTNNNIE